MTCIIGLKDKGKVYIGGDSAGVAGYDIVCRKDPKVFTNGKFVMGFTSSFRMGQLLMYMQVPHQKSNQSAYKFMVNTFIDSVRDCFKAGGYAKQENSVESGGQFIVGYRGNIYTVHSDYQVEIPGHRFTAIGCGQALALGSLYTTSRNMPQYSAQYKIKEALKVAAEFNVGVRAPFKIVSK